MVMNPYVVPGPGAQPSAVFRVPRTAGVTSAVTCWGRLGRVRLCLGRVPLGTGVLSKRGQLGRGEGLPPGPLQREAQAL